MFAVEIDVDISGEREGGAIRGEPRTRAVLRVDRKS